MQQQIAGGGFTFRDYMLRGSAALRAYLLSRAVKRYRRRPSALFRILIVALLHRHCDVLPISRLINASKSIVSGEVVIVSGTGNLVLTTRVSARIIPLSRQAETALLENFRNWKELRKVEVLSDLVEYKFELSGVPRAGRMTKLSALSEVDQQQAYAAIVRRFQRRGSDSLVPRWILNGWYSGIDQTLLGDGARFWRRVAAELAAQFWSIGPVHGDLTPSNMMSAQGRYVLIDLSRYRRDGLQFYDVMHFLIERESKRLTISWTQTILLDEFRKKWHVDSLSFLQSVDRSKCLSTLVKAYFLTRLMLDRAGERRNPLWKMKMRQTANKLLSEETP